MNRPLQPHRKNGFTLVEVLIALAITGMLISVLMSALFYIFRVQESLHQETVVREQELRGRSWFRIALAGCMPLAETNPLAFKGDNKAISCESNSAIVPGIRPVPLGIAINIASPESGTITLNYNEANRPPDKIVPLQQWMASEAKFKFVDSEGNELDQWPPSKAKYESLPRLVKLHVGAEGRQITVWVIAIGADPWMPDQLQLPPGFTPEMFK